MLGSLDLLVNAGALAVLGGAIFCLGACHAERAGLRMAYLTILILGLMAVMVLAAIADAGG